MQRSQLNDQVIRDLVRHLFDPNPKSRKATRALISPNLVLDFPFLPHTQGPTPATSTGTSTGTTAKRRHSPSAQALSAFRLGGFLVNHGLPGSQWTLDVSHAQDVSSQDQDWEDTFELPLGAARWRATLTWTLTLASPINLPFHLRDKLAMHHQSQREVELVFAPRESDEEKRLRKAREEERASEASGSRLTPTPGDDPDVQLVRVRYTGLHLPSYLNNIKLSEWVFKVTTVVLAGLLAQLFGVLLLFGLDHSTRTLDASWRKKRRHEKKRIRLTQMKNATIVKGKQRARESATEPTTPPKARVPSVSRSSPPRWPSDSEDGSDVTATTAGEDAESVESTYHRLMRKTNSSVDKVRHWMGDQLIFIKQTAAEISMLGSFMSKTISLLSLVGIQVANVGAEVLNEAGGSIEMTPEEAHQARLMQQAREGLHRHGRPPPRGKPIPHSEPEPYPSDTTWRRRPTSGRKRVSFSLSEPRISADQLDERDLPSPDRAFIDFRTGLDAEMEAAAASSVPTVDEEERGDPRYTNNFGLPTEVTESPYADPFSQAAHDAAVQARAQSRHLSATYSGEGSGGIDSLIFPATRQMLHEHNISIAASEARRKRSSLDSAYSQDNFPRSLGDAPRFDVEDNEPQADFGHTSTHEHVDTPIVTPVEEPAYNPFHVPESLIGGVGDETPRAGTPEIPGATTRYSPIAPPSSPLSTSIISPPSAPRPFAASQPPIAEQEEEEHAEQESSLGVLMGPQRGEEHIKDVEEAMEREEMEEINELIGAQRPRPIVVETTTTRVTTTTTHIISGATLAAAAEQHLYSPTSTSTPTLSPEATFPMGLTAAPRGSITSLEEGPQTPSGSPESSRRSLPEGEGGATSVKMEHESSGSWSSQGGVRSSLGGMEGKGGASVVVGEGHEGVESGTPTLPPSASSAGAQKEPESSPEGAGKKAKKRKGKKGKRGGAGAA